MKQSFKSTLKQTPSFSPQQQQAVKILQLNSAALSQQIQQELESNPFLESLEIVELESPLEIKTSNVKAQSKPSSKGNSSSAPSIKPQQNSSSKLGNELDSVSYAATSLQTHLHQQAIRTPMSERQHHAVELLIDSIKENGYLGCSLSEIMSYTLGEENYSLVELESALRQVQALEPVGVGCRNLGECLSIQLSNIEPQSSITQLAHNLVQHHLKSLSEGNLKTLSITLGANELSLKQAIKLIKALNPSPGSQIEATPTIYVSADILVSKYDGRWQTALNREHVPQVGLSSYTRDWLDQVKEPAKKKPLIEQANRAKMLLSQIEKRYQTTLNVATEIVERQQAFFNQGNIALQPLTLKQIAEALNIHISTVSRTVNGKYLQSNRGLTELKFFFSASIKNREGEISSARSVQATIEKMIREEAPTKPLSDNKITQQLNSAGLQVARRTVAKYREQLKIPASSVRRQLSNPSGAVNPGIN